MLFRRVGEEEYIRTPAETFSTVTYSSTLVASTVASSKKLPPHRPGPFTVNTMGEAAVPRAIRDPRPPVPICRLVPAENFIVTPAPIVRATALTESPYTLTSPLT